MQFEDLAYRVGVIGFIFRAFVIWVIYAGSIHARATRGWRGSCSAWLQIIGFAAIIFNFTIVNQFFTGLHAYSGL